MKRLKTYIPALSIFCLALLIRVIYNLTVAKNYVPVFDAAVYNNLAEELLKWHCYCLFDSHQPTTFRPPLWPFILATIYTITGEHNLYPRLFYCVLGSGTCVFIYLLAKDFFGKRIALLTGIIAALYPGLFIWDGWLYSESLFTFCLTALIYSFARLQSSMQSDMGANKKYHVSWRWMLSGGIFLGLTLLTRPTGTVIVGMLCLWAALLIFAKALPWQAVLKSLVVVMLVAIIINLPWMYRNYTVTHSISPISTIGTTLSGVYNDIEITGRGTGGINGMWFGPSSSINPDFRPYTVADEQKDTAVALSWIRTHLSAMPMLLGLHLLHLWTPAMHSFGLPSEESPQLFSSQIVTASIPIMSIPIFLLAAFGLLVTWTQKRKQLLMGYLVIALTVLQSVVFYGSPRFRAPIEPLLVLLAGGAIWWLICDEPGTLRHWRASKRRTQQPVEALPGQTVVQETLR